MRIAVDARFLGRDRRGMGRYVASLLDAIRTRPSAPDIVLLFDKTSISGVSNIDVCWCPWSRADLVVPGVATVVTIHDLAPFAHPQAGVLRALDRLHDTRRLEQAVAAADWIVTVSAFTRDELVTRLDANAARIAVIPEGVSASFFGSTLRSPDGPLMWVGTDDERKNIRRLLEAFAQLRRRDRRLRLVLCGDNPGLLARHRLALSGIDSDAVAVTGYLTDDDLIARYRSARLFVYPSLYEGFGLPVLEAMAAGTPVVCSDAAALREVGGDAAAYFDPEDVDGMAAAIRGCLDDDAWRATAAARGHAWAESFTWERAADRLLTLFERTICTTPV